MWVCEPWGPVFQTLQIIGRKRLEKWEPYVYGFDSSPPFPNVRQNEWLMMGTSRTRGHIAFPRELGPQGDWEKICIDFSSSVWNRQENVLQFSALQCRKQGNNITCETTVIRLRVFQFYCGKNPLKRVFWRTGVRQHPARNSPYRYGEVDDGSDFSVGVPLAVLK